jgi:Iron-containing redox enzyme
MNRVAIEFRPLVDRFLARLTTTQLHREIHAQLVRPERFRLFLQMMYHFVGSSSETLILAAGATRHEPIRAYLHRHAVEELGHERDVLADFVSLGGDGETLARSFPLPLCSGYIAHFRGAGLRTAPEQRLGAVYMIEHVGKELGPATHRRLLEAGIRRDQLTFVHSHTTLDDEHASDIAALLADDGLGDEVAAAAMAGARFAARTYAALFDAALADPGPATRPYVPPAPAEGQALMASLLAASESAARDVRVRSRIAAEELSGRHGPDARRRRLLDRHHWLAHAATIQCILAARAGTRWPAVKEHLWRPGAIAARRDALASELDRLDRGRGPAADPAPGYWTSLLLDWMDDAARCAPAQGLGLMLLLDRVESDPASASRSQPDLWHIVGSLDLDPAEQAQLHHGVVAGGYLYAMAQGDDSDRF